MSQEIERAAFREAMRISSPTWFGIGAWGLVVGVAMIKTGLTLPQALGMTLIVFAGSAQLAALPLIASGAPVWVIFLTALVVNLRFVIFSAILAPHFAHYPLRMRAWLGFITGDVTVAMFMQKYPNIEDQPGKLGYLKGLMYPNWTSWQVGSIIGIFLGSQIPSEWGLGFAGTLAILCIAIPMVQNRPSLIGIIVTGIFSLLTFHFPYKLGLIVSVILGMICAMVTEELMTRKENKSPSNSPGNVHE